MGKVVLEIILKPIWKWGISVPLEILGVISFFWPNWKPVLTWPIISEWIPWYYLVIIGLVILFFTTVWQAAKRIQDTKNGLELRDENQPIVPQRLKPANNHQPSVFDSPALAENVLIRYNMPELDQFENPKEFKFTVINETGHQLRNCYVVLDEVAFKPTKKRKDEWQIEEHLVSEKPFIWNHTSVALDGKIYHIDNGDRVSFTLGEQMSRVVREGEYKYYRFNFTFYKSTIQGLIENGLDYRLSISFRASYLIYYDITPASFYVYLQDKSEGVYVFDKLERLEEDGPKR